MGVNVGPPPGPGPVFEFEWMTATRRWQGYGLRSLFVVLLLAALVLTWWSAHSAGRAPATIRAMADIGGQFYISVIGTLLTLVLLAAPAATAGAICLDRARGALAHLLLTDLSDAEIVLGKLTARLVSVLGLVACSMPVMALLTLLGGVDPDALIGAFSVTLGLAVLGCALALVFSLWVGKTHEAMLATYAVWCFWLLGGMMTRVLNGAFGLTLVALPQTADPFYLAFAPYWHPGQVGWVDYLTFLGVCCAIASALTGLAIWRLRPVCTRENVRKPRRLVSRHLPTFARQGTRVSWVFKTLGPSLDWNPVLWREWHRNRPSRWGRLIGLTFATMAVTFSGIAMVSQSVMMMVVVNGFQVAIGLLLLSVSAATALAEERVRGSLDVLMTTTLSTRQIVLGKWLGSFRRAPWLAVAPALVILSADGPFGLRLAGAFVMTGYVVCCGAAVTSVGVALATWCTRLGRAVGLTVGAYVLMTVGWMFLVMAVASPDPFGWAMITGSPFYGALMITIAVAEQRLRRTDIHMGWGVLWMFLYGGLALTLLAATLVSFNRCLGRIESGLVSRIGREQRRYVIKAAKEMMESYERV